ncbi:TolB family protein [Nocardioides taihuensis]|uniref:TolB family protein n=1 Tax=Nocardioides taihuensis TaxID=1835606 RepID=A0ABW0BH36_9ACTN
MKTPTAVMLAAGGLLVAGAASATTIGPSAADTGAAPANRGVHGRATGVDPTAYPQNGMLVYTKQNNRDLDIYTVRPDGIQRTQLTFGGRASRPAWSPDGSQIAYVRDTRQGSQIKVMDPDGQNKRTVITVLGYPASLEWSPDGLWLAYSGPSETDGWEADIFQVEVASGAAQTLFGTEGYEEAPVWSPNGKKLLYMSWDLNFHGSRVFMLDTDAATTTEFALGVKHAGWATWTPDGAQVVYETYSDFEQGTDFYGFDLVAQDADGTHAHVLEDGPSDEREATFRPQGDRLCFSRGDSNFYRDPSYWYGLSTIAPDGTGYVRLTRTGEHEPVWSPDGRFIAAIRTQYSRGGNHQKGLWVLRANGSHLHQIVPGQVWDIDWQPVPDPQPPARSTHR